jgi:hypothetical protein
MFGAALIVVFFNETDAEHDFLPDMYFLAGQKNEGIGLVNNNHTTVIPVIRKGCKMDMKIGCVFARTGFGRHERMWSFCPENDPSPMRTITCSGETAIKNCLSLTRTSLMNRLHRVKRSGRCIMRIGLDLDGTILAIPAFFSILSHAMEKEGSEVHIITYRDNRRGAEEALRESGIAYTALHLPQGLGVEPEVWKREVALQLDLDIMVDDSPVVLAAMPEKVKRLWICESHMYDLNKAINGLLGE